MTTVRAQALSLEAFAPFGQVVSVGLRQGAAMNQGTAVRFDHAAELSNLRPGAQSNLAAVRSNPQRLPIALRLLERHPSSSQAFLPLRCARYLICVAPTLTDGSPDTAGLLAFVGTQGQGINYRAGVWHHPIVALDEPAEFAMLAWEDGTAGDCVEFPLPLPITVVE